MPSGLLATAAAVGALAAPAFGPARQVRPLPAAVFPSAVADGRGNQLLEYSLPGRAPSDIVLLRRAFGEPWTEDPAGAALRPGTWLTTFSAAGDGAALLGWANSETMGRTTLGALVRGPGGSAFTELGDTLPAGWQHAAVNGTATIDASGRVVAVATVGHGRAPATLELAIRPPHGRFGAARVLDTRTGAPSLATSPGGRSVLTWTAGARTRMLTIERGVVGRPVIPTSDRFAYPQVAVGRHGEAVVAWGAGRTIHGTYHFRRRAIVRGRHGGFGRPFALPSSAVGAPVVGDDGRIVFAQTRSAPRRRRAKAAARKPDTVVVEIDVIDPRPPHRTRRTLLSRGIRIAGPVVTPVDGGALVAWTSTLGGDDNHRGVRAVSVLGGRVSRVADVADYRGAASRGVLALRGADGGATLLWLAGNRDTPYELDAADTALALGG